MLLRNATLGTFYAALSSEKCNFAFGFLESGDKEFKSLLRIFLSFGIDGNDGGRSKEKKSYVADLGW